MHGGVNNQKGYFCSGHVHGLAENAERNLIASEDWSELIKQCFKCIRVWEGGKIKLHTLCILVKGFGLLFAKAKMQSISEKRCSISFLF